jgi:endonuclease YncB( thermonuclease family)
VLKKILNNFLFLFFILFQQHSFALEIKGYPRIIDGDSIEINKRKIRLFGIDAPEIKQVCKKPFLTISFFAFQKDYKCGLLAKNELKKFLQEKEIICISEKKDKYKRYLSICYLQKKDINAWLVKNGYALAYERYSKKYIFEQEYAKNNKLGIWKGTFLSPEKWRKNK